MTTMTILRTNNPTYLCAEDCIEKMHDTTFYYGEKHNVRSADLIDEETLDVVLEMPLLVRINLDRMEDVRQVEHLYFNPEDVQIDEWDGIYDD